MGAQRIIHCTEVSATPARKPFFCDYTSNRPGTNEDSTPPPKKCISPSSPATRGEISGPRHQHQASTHSHRRYSGHPPCSSTRWRCRRCPLPHLGPPGSPPPDAAVSPGTCAQDHTRHQPVVSMTVASLPIVCPLHLHQKKVGWGCICCPRNSVTLEISAEVPAGVPDTVVRIVTENSRTLKFSNQGFEAE